MDTTYAGIMLVVFLVLAGLAIDVGYMYIGEEELQSAAETSALAGAQAIKQRILTQIQTDPKNIRGVVNDPVQSSARAAAIDLVSGKHAAAALVGVASDSSNALNDKNDVTVGFWNVSTHTYTPGGAPVNAIQVRTKRTAESESVGMGSLGSFIAKISGIETFNYTPVAVAAIPARTHANIAMSVDACGSDCIYPNICSIPERKMIRDYWDTKKDPPAIDRYAFTSLLHPVTGTITLSDMICKEMPAQEVCGKAIFTTQGANNDALRDMESMMYDPHVDKSNKEYDKATGKLSGWWVIVPVTDRPPAKQGDSYELHSVARYALIRISRICVSGTTGCIQVGGPYDAPSSICGGDGNDGLYIDRISCVGCGSQSMLHLPGLQPVLVK
ncbi:MAG: hypothetical protein FD174_3630 [Geobacteraceae bacterium]|nr:MAG: hypothetical protein FD174_3630 [Geobacteraceae bacterium]